VERFAEILHAHLGTVCRLSNQQIVSLHVHLQLYQRWSRVLNLSSIREFRSAVVKHYCESLFLAAKLPGSPLSIVDVGSGAGFPGIPVAIFRPDCHICLVESHQRKAVFLKEATRGQANVDVKAKRAEEVESRFDWLISRAVSWKDLRPIALRTASRVGLLVAEAGASRIMKESGLTWEEPLPLPWAPQDVLLVGDVSRET
jgi:16S rRNA (guanine527-N7)-methyltransferase